MCLSKYAKEETSIILQDPLDTDCFKTEFEDNCNYIDIGDTSEITCSNTDLSVIQVNCRGLIGKQVELSQLLFKLLGNRKIDIVILVEMWLTQESEKRLCIPGFIYYGNIRVTKKGGGVGFLIRKELPFRPRPDLIDNDSVVESCFIELRNSEKQIIIASLYRPPNTNVQSFLKHYKKVFTGLRGKDLIIGLDHNLNLLKYHDHSGTRDYLELLIELEHFPCITHPTRITHHSATLIDNIIVTKRLHCVQHSGIVTSDLSDHLSCLTIIQGAKSSKLEQQKVIKQNLSKRNIGKIIDRLHSIKLEYIHENTHDIDLCMDYYHDQVMSCIDLNAPKIECLVSSNRTYSEPWMTKGLRKCGTKQLQLYKNSLSSQKAVDCKKYKQYRNNYKKIKRQAKRDYYFLKCTEFKSNTKKLWQMINNVTNVRKNNSCIIECLSIDNIVSKDKAAIANHMNKYFTSIGMQYAKSVNESDVPLETYLNKISKNEKTIFLHPTNKDEVLRLLNVLTCKSSSGWDGISNKLLKSIKEVVAEPLAIIFNISIKTGIFPKIFKAADIIPLYKSGPKKYCTNYRPISLLLTMSKLLEKIIYKRVYRFLNTTGQIYQSQYGFRTNYSCENAIQELLGKILKGMENKQFTIAIFLDLSKAFDSLEHSTLLRKLEAYGIRGNAQNWFKSYLLNRQIRVKCNTGINTLTVSEYEKIEYGVPQGSCLGPLLFLTFCNDLPLNLTLCKSILFADDTTIYKSGGNLRYLEWCICEELKHLTDWFRANKLTLNLGKSCCVLFGNTQDSIDLNLQIGSEVIPVKDCTKFLGVWIDSKLNWSKHLNTVIMKIKRNMHLLRTSKNFMDVRTRKVILHAHIVSHINYCLSVWGNMITLSQKQQLDNILDKCKKLVCKTNFDGMINVNNLILLENYKFGYKLSNRLLPKTIEECALQDHRGKSLQKNHKYHTQNKHLPNYPKITCTKYKNSIYCKGPQEFALLGSEIRGLNNLKAFVRSCKCKLRSNQ